MSDVTVQTGATISIYSSRDAYDKKDADKTYVSNGQQQNYKNEIGSIIDRIKGLDGDSTNLSDEDLAIAKKEAGSIFMSDLTIKRDAKVGITTIEQAGKVYCFDFYLENEKTQGVKQLEKDIANGEAKYQPWYNIENLLNNLFETGASLFEDDILVSCPDGTTMREVKNKYHLPDGALKSYVSTFRHASGNRDDYTVDGGCVWFSAKAFAKGNGITIEQVKAFFADKK